jgi:hypothetical protein
VDVDGGTITLPVPARCIRLRNVVGQTSRIDLDDGVLNVTGNAVFNAIGDTQLSAVGTGRLTGGDILFRGSRLRSAIRSRSVRRDHDAANLTVQVGLDFVANAGSRIIADQLVTLEVGGSAIRGGAVAAPEARIRSADVAIGGSVGDAGTQLTTLTIVPAVGAAFAEQVVLGGTSEGPGYTLTDAEANRITSATLRVDAPVTGTAPNRPADVPPTSRSMRRGSASSISTPAASSRSAAISSSPMPAPMTASALQRASGSRSSHPRAASGCAIPPACRRDRSISSRGTSGRRASA